MTIQRLAEELANLKEELAAMAGDGAAAALSASREKIDGAARLLGEALDEAEQLVAREEESLESFIARQPLVSVAAAFAAGLAVGAMLRRR
jgi:ElaB/YqjD/DUF883 family membrane-anchored ribosome-binding protein